MSTNMKGFEKKLQSGQVTIGDIRRWQNWNKANKEAKFTPTQLAEMWIKEKIDNGAKDRYVKEIVSPAVSNYIAFCEAMELEVWDSVSVGEFVRFLLLEKKYATKTIMDKFEKIIGHFFDWACVCGYIPHGLDRSKYPRLLVSTQKRKPVDLEDVRTALKNIHLIPEFDQELFRFFVFTAWHTGFRPSDILALNWDDIDLEQNKISIIPIKTSRFGKRVDVYFSDEYKNFLVSFKEKNPPLLNSTQCCSMFLRNRGTERIKSSFNRYLKRTIGKSIGCTDFRRAKASTAKEVLKDIDKVKSTVGWSSAVAARRYITETEKTKRENWNAISINILASEENK